MSENTKNISLQQAVEDIKQIFDATPFDNKQEGKSFYVIIKDTTTFFFDKKQYFRHFIIEKLYEYFNDKIIDDGQCRIEPLTVLYTVVHFEPRNNK